MPCTPQPLRLEEAPGITTLMLRNIPVTFNRESLLADFDARGFRGRESPKELSFPSVRWRQV